MGKFVAKHQRKIFLLKIFRRENNFWSYETHNHRTCYIFGNKSIEIVFYSEFVFDFEHGFFCFAAGGARILKLSVFKIKISADIPYYKNSASCRPDDSENVENGSSRFFHGKRIRRGHNRSLSGRSYNDCGFAWNLFSRNKLRIVIDHLIRNGKLNFLLGNFKIRAERNKKPYRNEKPDPIFPF